ncbi:MAG: methyltransferase domain-containing protein [Actinomycetota bacterium]|nr:methyltransferase domain-containing protein [Actinomycetota bacterium]
MSEPVLYESIGRGYTATRGADPRIAEAIWKALGEARSVLNVGAGAGSYEPRDRQVLAVEPSAVMIAQRPADAAPVVRAIAEALPLADASMDAAMAVLSDHHWHDRRRALRELRRVARHRVVLFNADPAQAERFWLTREYLPGFLRLIPERYREPGAWARDFVEELGPVQLQPLLIPHDCDDGFYGAFWRRPDAYLNPRVRAGISVFVGLPEPEVTQAMNRLRDDLASGVWHKRHRDLLDLDACDLGYYLVIA